MADDGTYRTVTGRGRAAFAVRGSEFVGHAAPARTVGDAEALLDAVADEHPDATHHVPAYRVREGDLLREHSDDDGEPTGSAGKPALNVLARRELENVAVVVARTFGGTELGVGGLARAYARATKEAVDAAGVVAERPREAFVATVEYDDSGTVRSVLESAGVPFSAEYEERVRFEVEVPVADAAALRDRLRSATSGRIEIR